MIGKEDIYQVVVAMVPLYMALALGYGSVKWWRMFKPDQCDAINRFNCYFIIPFFTFHFTSTVDPYHMNYKFLAADAIAKAIAGITIALWSNLWRRQQGKENYSWAITSFSLSSFNNSLVVGVPLLKAMYGRLGEDMVIQSSVIQSLLWLPILLFMLELWRSTATTICSRNTTNHDLTTTNSNKMNNEEQLHAAVSSSIEIPVALSEESNSATAIAIDTGNDITAEARDGTAILSSSNFGSLMKKVWRRLGTNPNIYACLIGLIWALVANRWNLKMPSIVEGSILIMSKAGSGVAMFTMGLFMALQEKLIGCGVRLTLFGMVMRFVAGPFAISIGSLALGLRSNVLRIAIIQAALPQAIVSFVFAQEYGLHVNVLSTAVIFGTIVSLPLLIAYYLVLDVMH